MILTTICSHNEENVYISYALLFIVYNYIINAYEVFLE